MWYRVSGLIYCRELFGNHPSLLCSIQALQHKKKPVQFFTVKIENQDCYCHPTNKSTLSCGLTSFKANIFMQTLQNAHQSHIMAMPYLQYSEATFLLQCQGNQCGICSGQSRTKAGSPPRLSFMLTIMIP
jgi:hypothetical protein